MYSTVAITRSQQQDNNEGTLQKKINDEKDLNYFRSQSPACKTIAQYVELLCERILATGSRVFSHKYQLENEVFVKCSEFLSELEKSCDETDLTAISGASSLRFGHIAFRDWFDSMKKRCHSFVEELADSQDLTFREELSTYLSESFGNRMRIDYGTGHELNFIIFTMGLCNLVEAKGESGDKTTKKITVDRLKPFVMSHGWDVIALFTRHYLKLCRRLQIKFRLEPAGSRGVYNMDDFQFLPFLFGTAQLSGVKYIPTSDFYQIDQVDQFKNDFIFFEAIDFILNNKRGPFNEHSYTLWNFTSIGSWDNIYRRIKSKFNDDILGPFPIVQHLVFGKYILRWSEES